MAFHDISDYILTGIVLIMLVYLFIKINKIFQIKEVLKKINIIKSRRKPVFCERGM